MCPVCQSILHQPVLFPCGNHSACRSCLLTYLASEIVVDEALDTGEARCPQCRDCGPYAFPARGTFNRTLQSQCELRFPNQLAERRVEEDQAAIERDEELVENIVDELKERPDERVQEARDQAAVAYGQAAQARSQAARLRELARRADEQRDRARAEAQREREHRAQAEADAEHERTQRARAYRFAISTVAIGVLLVLWRLSLGPWGSALACLPSSLPCLLCGQPPLVSWEGALLSGSSFVLGFALLTTIETLLNKGPEALELLHGFFVALAIAGFRTHVALYGLSQLGATVAFPLGLIGTVIAIVMRSDQLMSRGTPVEETDAFTTDSLLATVQYGVGLGAVQLAHLKPAPSESFEMAMLVGMLIFGCGIATTRDVRHPCNCAFFALACCTVGMLLVSESAQHIDGSPLRTLAVTMLPTALRLQHLVDPVGTSAVSNPTERYWLSLKALACYTVLVVLASNWLASATYLAVLWLPLACSVQLTISARSARVFSYDTWRKDMWRDGMMMWICVSPDYDKKWRHSEPRDPYSKSTARMIAVRVVMGFPYAYLLLTALSSGWARSCVLAEAASACSALSLALGLYATRTGEMSAQIVASTAMLAILPCLALWRLDIKPMLS